MNRLISILVVFHIAYTANCQNISKDVSGAEILEKTIIVKFKKSELKSSTFSYSTPATLPVHDFIQTLNIEEFKQLYPHAKAPDCKECVDIRLIFRIKYHEDIPEYKVIATLNTFPEIEYAEPLFIHYALDVPDDPKQSSQYNLDTIDLYEAWDINKGDSTIVVGIVDTEFDLNHEDLIDQVAYNYLDLIDGIDNDNDGYIDNFRGWDMADYDNDPSRSAESGYHGSIVAGIACARTNNGAGIAGVGYHTKFLPIKVLSSMSGYITAGYDGIVYAADHGCSIINCSWGSSYNSKLYAQDIIDYATFNRNALVIGAAGNNDNTTVIYPASLNHVMSVSGTAKNDEKYNPDNSGGTSGSNWNIFVDIAAPASGYLAPSYNDKYTNTYGGTSFASPHVAGVAALLKAQAPNLNAIQIGEQLKVSADRTFYNITYNNSFYDLLGYGRLNALNALSDTLLPSVYFENIDYVSKSENIIANDTVTIIGYFKNYLKQYEDITIRLYSDNEYIKLLSEFFYIESIGENDSVSNSTLPFTFYIYDNAPATFQITFKLEMEALNYYSYQYFTLDVSQYSFDITVNNMTTTVTSNGKTGLLKGISGKKICYKEFPPILYDGGLFYGNSNVLNPRLASCFRGTNDFALLSKPITITDPNFDIVTYTKFNDVNALDRSYGFETEQKLYGITNDSVDFIIYENLIYNASTTNYTDLYFGLFADIDLLNSQNNVANFDAETGMLYMFNVQSNNLFAGMMVLSENSYSRYAIDNTVGNTVYLNDEFTELEKQICLLNERNAAGFTTMEGNDVAGVVSAYEKKVNNGDTVEFTYVILCAETLSNLKESAKAAKNAYEKYLNPPPITHIPYINNINISVSPALVLRGEKIYVTGFSNVESYKIITQLGTVLETKNISGKNAIAIKTDTFNAGIYFLQLEGLYTNICKPFVVK